MPISSGLNSAGRRLPGRPDRAGVVLASAFAVPAFVPGRLLTTFAIAPLVLLSAVIVLVHCEDHPLGDVETTVVQHKTRPKKLVPKLGFARLSGNFDGLTASIFVAVLRRRT